MTIICKISIAKNFFFILIIVFCLVFSHRVTSLGNKYISKVHLMTLFTFQILSYNMFVTCIDNTNHNFNIYGMSIKIDTTGYICKPQAKMLSISLIFFPFKQLFEKQLTNLRKKKHIYFYRFVFFLLNSCLKNN